MEVHLADRSLPDRIGSLPAGDRRLLATPCVLGLVALLVGVIAALGMVVRMAGAVAVGEALLYELLTVHATTAFYYWLYFVQAGVILAVVRVYAPGVDRLRWRALGWAGCGLMTAGLVANLGATVAGAAVTYVGLPGLASSAASGGAFYLGYLLLAAGLACLAVVALGTALEAKRATRADGDGDRDASTNGGGDENADRGRTPNPEPDGVWPSLLFAGVVWWGLAAVSVVASVNAYLPPLLSTAGIAVETPAGYLMNWAVLFHNMHYLPLVSAVIVWYVVAEAATGASVKEAFSGRLSKVVFAGYLMLVPPTSLYHMFLSPSVSGPVKAVGSVLSLAMSVPTVLHFLIVLTAVEAAARSRGAGGRLGWIRALPWDNPGFAGVGWGVACAAGGGLLANVLVQHGFAPLLSDTLFVPAYFHFFTAGTVTLTFLGALAYVLPALVDARLPLPGVLARLSAVATVGVYAFGVAGAVAGYLGVPRRTIAVAYGGPIPEAWGSLLAVVAVGGAIMGVAIGGAACLLLSVVGRPAAGIAPAEFPRVAWGGPVSRDETLLGGAITVAVLLSGWTALTVLTDAFVGGLPVGAIGISLPGARALRTLVAAIPPQIGGAISRQVLETVPVEVVGAIPPGVAG